MADSPGQGAKKSPGLSKRAKVWLLALGVMLGAVALKAIIPRALFWARDDNRIETLEEEILLTWKLHDRMPPTRPGDWLASHSEPGQLFWEYVGGNPIRPTEKRRVIYARAIGEFDPFERKIAEATFAFMEDYFGLPVKELKPVPLASLPESAFRVWPVPGQYMGPISEAAAEVQPREQISCRYLIDDLLAPALPEDGMALVGLTASDLWPGTSNWNFVFGQASLQDRTGVWSIARFGDPSQDMEAFQRCLLRTLKLATHETGHMFGMWHCVEYRCNMNGSNTLPETDSHPLWFCPECAAKICWATGDDMAERYKRLAKFCAAYKLEEEKDFYERAAAAIEAGF